MRKKEERRRSQRERKREKEIVFLTREEREVNKNIYIYFLDVSYSAHLKIDVHCSTKKQKILLIASLLQMLL